MTFPSPWNDEARFYLPSWNFAQSGSLSPEILNAPHGIYWVPDGFYIWIGTFLAIFGRSIFVAQVVCEVSVSISVIIFARAFLQLTGSPLMAAAFGLILISPPIIFAANMVRMESLLCLLFATAVWLHINRAYLAAGSLLLLSILIHPALALAFAGYVGAMITTNSPRTEILREPWQTIAEQILFVLVLFALVAEITRIIFHFHLFTQHMHYQTLRKLSINRWRVLIKPQATLFYLEIGTILTWFRLGKHNFPISERRLLLPLIAATLGMQAYAFLGGETAYDVYSLSIGPALFISLFYRAMTSSCSSPIAAI